MVRKTRHPEIESKIRCQAVNRSSAVHTLTDNLHRVISWRKFSPMVKKPNANTTLNPGMSSAVTVKHQTVKQLKVRHIDGKLLICQLFWDPVTPGNQQTNYNFVRTVQQAAEMNVLTGNQPNFLLFMSLVRLAWSSLSDSFLIEVEPLISTARTDRQEEGEGNYPGGNTNKAPSLALQYQGIRDSDTFANDQAVAGSTSGCEQYHGQQSNMLHLPRAWLHA